MIAIQIILIVFALGVLVFMVVGGQTHSARAYKKIGLFVLVLMMIAAVSFPDITNVIARAVGVGRGADLLLYAFVLAFIIYALNAYIRQQKEKDSLYRLARKVAVLEARERYGFDESL